MATGRHPDQATMEKLQSKGQAMAPAAGSDRPRYQIRNGTDLDRAIKAVGRGSGSHNTIRAYIIRRAKALGLSSKIPGNWNSDGSLKGGSGDNDNDGD